MAGGKGRKVRRDAKGKGCLRRGRGHASRWVRDLGMGVAESTPPPSNHLSNGGAMEGRFEGATGKVKLRDMVPQNIFIIVCLRVY